MLLLVLLLLVSLWPAEADSRSEAALRAELAAAQAELAAAGKERAANKLAIDKLAAETKKQAAAAAAQRQTVSAETKQNASDARSAAVEAGQAATDQTAVATQAAEKAATAAEYARQAADSAKSGNNGLIIIQLGTFLALVIGYIYKREERRMDIAEKVRIRAEDLAETIRKEGVTERHRLEAVTESNKQGAQLRQIHTLVNSNLSASIQSDYEGRQANLVLLLEAVDAKKRLGIEPSQEALAVIAAMKIKIDELSAVLVDRAKQTAEAARQFQVETKT